MSITRNDVARLAGVSTATVSYVVNSGPRPVSTELRQKVLDAIKELGYQPSEIARSLKTKRSTTIGVLISDILNPVLSAIAKSIEDAILPMGYNMILCNSDEDPERELTFLRMLFSKQVDGIILLPTGKNIDYITTLVEKLKMPIVLIDRLIEGLAYDNVLFDNISGAYEVTRHLLGLGHRRIGLIGLPSHLTPGRERRIGYDKAHLESGYVLDPGLVVEGSFKAHEGRRLVEALLKNSNPPTALVVSSNRLLNGVLQYVKEYQIDVPGDLALAVFDDVPYYRYYTPSITSVGADEVEFGRKAAQLLKDRINCEIDCPPQSIRIPCFLRVRESTIGLKS
jgi:DNA-binding LacI/PurR family transcriptional regulator